MFQVFLFCILLLVIYNIPSIFAVIRRHPDALKIMIVNILFGWTIIGWIIALAWSGWVP